MGELVELLTRALVESPGDVAVTERSSGDDILIEVTVAPDDVGRVIGRGGKIANAIRTVARAAAPEGRRVIVEILD